MIDPGSVRAIMSVLFDELLMWLAGRAIVEQAMADVREMEAARANS